MNLPQLAPNGRGIIVGPTGCGKTELAKRLLRTIGAERGTPARNVIVVDPKHRFAWDDPDPYFARNARTIPQLVEQLREIEAGGRGEPIVFRPPDPTDYLASDRVAAIALARGHTTLYYDELSLTTGPGDPRYTAPEWARAMVTGRGLGVGVLNTTQRPTGIPKVAKTEAEARFTFYLRDEGDRKVVDQIFGGGVPWDTLADEEFSFVHADDRALRGRSVLQPIRLPDPRSLAAARSPAAITERT